MSRLRLGVVGVGHLGKEHARILAGLPEVELVGVADSHGPQAVQVAQRCRTQAFSDHRELLPLVDAAVVVVPTIHHRAVAVDFLRRGIPLLIEKPLACTLQEADELVGLARLQGTVLQVGHIERFNPAFEELQRRPLQPKFIQSERLGGFSGRSTDIGVVLDLMIHDLDLVLTLVQSPVRSVEALGAAVLGGHEDLVQARVAFANGCIAQLTASRVHPSAVRRMHVWGPEGYAGVDFATRRLTLVQPGEHLRQSHFDSRRLDPATQATIKTDLFQRHLQTCAIDCSGGDQLTQELLNFVHCVQTGDRPRVEGLAGRDALALASAILESVRRHRWEDNAGSAMGPWQLPAPHGKLFEVAEQRAA
jgi:predicted dehydrogenase